MKEYLIKDVETGKYFLTENHSNFVGAIEVPEGAELLTQDDGGTLTFWNEDDSFNVGINNEWISPQDGVLSYREYCKQKFIILWSREQEIKMKEYLSKVNGKYELIKVIEVEAKEAHAKGWIEIPEGADYLTLHTSKSGYFWTEDGKHIGWGGANDIHPEWKQYEMGEGVHHYTDERNIKIVWRREKTVEYLDPSDWSLKVVGENSKISGDWILVPEGSDAYMDGFSGLEKGVFYKGSYSELHLSDLKGWEPCGHNLGTLLKNGKLRWTRHTQPEELPFIDDEPKYKELDQIILENSENFAIPESWLKDDPVNHPSHYVAHPSGIECIEITRHHDFTIGNAIKYLWRAGLKDSDNEVQDLKKAIWYIQDKINQLEKSNVSHNQGS